MMSNNSNASRRDSQSKKHKKKKDKKKKKKKDKKKKDKKKKKKKKRSGSTTGSGSSSDDSDNDWKFDDKGVNYGSPERLSDGQSAWEGKSQELYDSDNPECPLNLYHQESAPRLLEIADTNEDGDVRLELDFMTLLQDDANALKKEKLTYVERKREEERKQNHIDHLEYQNRKRHRSLSPIILNNFISLDFIRGVSKNLTCPICQEMVVSPVIYKSCLHRFCNTCIESYNRLGKKECPLCRKSIGNRRQLRPDKNI